MTYLRGRLTWPPLASHLHPVPDRIRLAHDRLVGNAQRASRQQLINPPFNCTPNRLPWDLSNQGPTRSSVYSLASDQPNLAPNRISAALSILSQPTFLIDRPLVRRSSAPLGDRAVTPAVTRLVMNRLPLRRYADMRLKPSPARLARWDCSGMAVAERSPMQTPFAKLCRSRLSTQHARAATD